MVGTKRSGPLFLNLPSEQVGIKGNREDTGRGDNGETKRQEMNWPAKGQPICRKCHIELLLSATAETRPCVALYCSKYHSNIKEYQSEHVNAFI